MDNHDRQSRALLAIIMARKADVDALVANYQDNPEGYVENWLIQQGHPLEKSASLAPHLRSALETMTPRGALREASQERRGPNCTDL